MFDRRISLINLLAVLVTIIAIALSGCGGAMVAPSEAIGELFPEQDIQVTKAVTWLVNTHQNDDGGFSSFSAGANQAPSDIAGTLDGLLAISTGNATSGDEVVDAISASLGFLASDPESLRAFAMENGGQAGKLILVLTMTDQDPRDFAGLDIVQLLSAQLEPSGTYQVTDTFKQSLAILGLAAAGEAVPQAAVTWLVDQQAENGSWDDGFGTLDNPDATAMAIMGLLAAGEEPSDDTIVRAIDFLRGSQETTGGWAYSPGLGASANSTALVIQALQAVGEDWYTDSGPWSSEGNTPLDALLSFQSDSGAFQADFGDGPFDDYYSTTQTIPALAGKTWVLAGD